MLEERSNHKFTYNEYVVESVKIIKVFVFVRTYSKTTGEIFWFIGLKASDDINTTIKKTLTEGTCYPNQYFKSMFEDNYKQNLIKLKETKSAGKSDNNFKN